MKKWSHFAFLAVCAAVLIVLWKAPRVTTPSPPSDADHQNLREYAKCASCHGLGSEHPMPAAGSKKPHLLAGGGLRGEFQKCYMCHRKRR